METSAKEGTMGRSIKYTSYLLMCLRDKQHGEHFVIDFSDHSQPVFLTHRLSEDRLRAVMSGMMGLSENEIENAIRRSRELADLRQQDTPDPPK